MLTMRRVSRVVPMLALGLILALALSGCVHEDRSVSLNGDGSGTYTLALGLSDQLLSLGSDEIGASMDQAGAQVKQGGGSYSKHDDGSYTVWTFSRPFKTVADLNALLHQPLTSGSIGDGAASASTDTFTVSESPAFFANSFHVTGHMSMASPNGQPPSSDGGTVAQMLKDMRESFAITMPGRITAHTGGTVSGNTISYTIHYGQQTSIDVSASALTGAGIASIAFGVVLLLLIIAGVVVLLVMRRQRAASSAAAIPVPATVGAPYSPVSASSYPPDAPTLASSFPAPDAPSASPVDQSPGGPVSPDAPTEQG